MAEQNEFRNIRDADISLRNNSIARQRNGVKKTQAQQPQSKVPGIHGYVDLDRDLP